MCSASPPSSPVRFSSSLVLSSPPPPTDDFDDRVYVDLIDRGADSLTVLVDLVPYVLVVRVPVDRVARVPADIDDRSDGV
ncbi:unnamed protein product [Closterium sp. NIES-54]